MKGGQIDPPPSEKNTFKKPRFIRVKGKNKKFIQLMKDELKWWQSLPHWDQKHIVIYQKTKKCVITQKL